MQQREHLEHSRADRTRRRVKILLIEDNETDVWLFREAFEALRLDHEIQVAGDGEAALEILMDPDRSDALPEIILLDINIPKLDGFAVLTAMRADPNLRSIPVIMLSSSRDQRDVRRAHELGANSYLFKSVSDFSDLVGDFDRYWLRRAELPLQH